MLFWVSYLTTLSTAKCIRCRWYERMSVVHWWNYSDRGKQVVGQRPVSVLLCPPEIPHGLAWGQSRPSTVRSRRLTAGGMELPSQRYATECTVRAVWRFWRAQRKDTSCPRQESTAGSSSPKPGHYTDWAIPAVRSVQIKTNYSVADLHRQYKKYIHKRTKHLLL